MADLIASARYCVSRCLQTKPPDPDDSIIELLMELKITPRQVNDMYRTFTRMKQHDPLESSHGQYEVSSKSMQRMIREKREWVGHLLGNLLSLADCRETVGWNEFLFVFLQYCTLSKLEMCQVVFYVIALQSKSWTVHFLTTTQLEEFYDDFQECPVRAFNTKAIDFAKLPSAKYYMTDFVDLGYRFSQLINPFLHIQRELQRAMPSVAFWGDVDNIRIQNRSLGIGFLRHKRVLSLVDLVKAKRAEQQAKITGVEIVATAKKPTEDNAKETKRKILENQGTMPIGYIPIPFGVAGPVRESRYPEPEMKGWMRKLLSENADPVRGIALGWAAEEASPPDVSPVLLEPWVAVPDPDRPKRLYFWNRETNEVTWTPPPLAQVPSVQESKANIRSSMGVPVKRGGGFSEGLQSQALARDVEEFEAAMARTVELDFVCKARYGEPKREDMVSVLEKTSPMELLIRPER